MQCAKPIVHLLLLRFQGLGNMVNEIVMGLMRHQNPFLSPEAPRTTQSSSSQPAATASTTGDQPDGGQPAGNLPADLPFIHALRNLLQNRTVSLHT